MAAILPDQHNQNKLDVCTTYPMVKASEKVAEYNPTWERGTQYNGPHLFDILRGREICHFSL